MTALASYWNRMADQLDLVRVKICYYGAGENQTCDCKYGVSADSNMRLDEQNGCPELRALIKIYRNQAERVVSQST